MSIGVLQHEEAFLYAREKQSNTENMEHLRPVGRRDAYNADITYGTNHEFGFDYLRDNMAVSIDNMVQRQRHFAGAGALELGFERALVDRSGADLELDPGSAEHRPARGALGGKHDHRTMVSSCAMRSWRSA